MKLNINFLQTGGVPLTNDLMGDIMSAVKFYDVLGELAGNLTIISGCEIVGTNVGSGVVAIDGDLLYFEGGAIVSTVYVYTEQIAKTFQDQVDKILIEKKTVRFGNGTVNYNWADFFRLETLKEIQQKVNNSVSIDDFNLLKARVEVLEMKTAPIQNGGIVWAWFKPLAEIPAGWKECLDTRGKTIVGLDPNDVDFFNLKSTLGEKKHALTISELPSHSHGYDRAKNYGSASGNAIGHPDLGFDYMQTSSVGGNQAHNNIQPSIIAYFIEPNF